MSAALAGITDAECAVAANFRAGALKPFRVTVSVVGQPAEQISILSRTSSDAAVQVMHLLFSDADDCIATTSNFRLMVEEIRSEEAAISHGAA